MDFQKWKNRFVDDFKRKQFYPIKGLFFLCFGANVALVPYLTLQARSLGITEVEVSIIYAFIPVAAIAAPLISGMIADKLGNFKILLSAVTAMAGLSSLLFILVPVGRMHHVLPNNLPVEFMCSENGTFLSIKNSPVCLPPDERGNFSANILRCSVKCLDQYENFLPNTSNIHCLQDEALLSNSTDSFNSTSEESESYGSCFLANQISPLSLSNASYSFSSKIDSTNLTIDFMFINGSWAFLNTTTSRLIEVDYTKSNLTGSKVNYQAYGSICPRLNKDTEYCSNTVTICEAEVRRPEMCSNADYIQEFNPDLTFYSHLFIRLFKEFSLSSSLPLLEGAAISILSEHNGDLGFQRIYCNLGMMVITPISGTLIDYYSRVNGFEDFRPAIYMYCILKVTAALIILFLNLEFKKSSETVVADFSNLIVKPQIIFFLFAAFLAGTCYGFIETWLFWLLEDLGADKQLMGITVTLGSVFGIPLLLISTFILKKIGHVNTIVFGFMVYVVRLFGYTIISSPWYAMPFEALECFTVSLMVVGFVSYASFLATPSTVVTLQGLYGGIYNGVGRGAGSLIGGNLIEKLGILNAFRCIAALGGLSGVMYWIVNMCLFRKSDIAREEEIQDEKKKNRPQECITTKKQNCKNKDAESGKKENGISTISEQMKEINGNTTIESKEL